MKVGKSEFASLGNEDSLWARYPRFLVYGAEEDPSGALKSEVGVGGTVLVVQYVRFLGPGGLRAHQGGAGQGDLLPGGGAPQGQALGAGGLLRRRGAIPGAPAGADGGQRGRGLDEDVRAAGGLGGGGRLPHSAPRAREAD